MSGKRAVKINGDIVLRPHEKRRIALALLQSVTPAEDDAKLSWEMRRLSGYLRRMLDAPADEALVDGTEVLDADEDYNEPEGGNNSSEDDDTQK